MSGAKDSGSLKRSPPKLSRRDIFGSTIGAAGVAAGQLSTGWPDSFLRWALLVGGALAGGLVARIDTVDFLWDRANTALRKLQPAPLRKTILALLILAVTLLIGRTVAVAGPPLVNAARIEFLGCPHPVQLRLLATHEGLQSARELADAFERHTAAGNFHCPKTNLYVYAAKPADAQRALSAGWTNDDLKGLGPRPDIWLPGSTIYAADAAASQGRLSKVATHGIATTPIILAVPADRVGDDIRVSREGMTWSQALATAQEREWGAARPDPSQSLAGLLGTIAIYESLGKETGRPLEAAQARLLEHRLEQTLDRGGYPLGDELDLLCRHIRPDPPATAVIITEQQLVRFNAERPLGGPCAATASSAHRSRMVGIYPSDTRGIDYPVSRLEWQDSSNNQLEQAQAFTTWLVGADGRRALLDAGLRPHGDSGGLPGVVFDAKPPTTDSVVNAKRTYELAKRPGRVLLAVDTSGSMRQRVAEQGPTRFEVAVKGVSGALAMMGERDEFGMWVFPDVLGARELLSIGPGRPRRQQAEAALGGITPTGPTPLYRTIVDGVKILAGGNADAVKALVVLTDGEDYGSGLSRAQLVSGVRGSDVRVFVIAVGEASCAAQGLIDVTEQTGGTCRQTDFGGLNATLADLFTLLWKGA